MGRAKNTVSLAELDETIDDVFDNYVVYRTREPYYTVELSTRSELIQHEILECGSDVLADAIVENLYDKREYGVVHARRRVRSP